MEEASKQLIQQRIQDLRENTDFVSAIFDHLVGYAIIAADFDGNVLAYNRGAHLIYGYAPGEVVGQKKVEIFFSKEFVEAGKLQDLIARLIEKEGFCCECEKVKKNGDSFPAQILYTLTKDTQGKVVGFIEFVEDLTERKRAEQTEARANAARIEQLERELHALMSYTQTSVTARMFGIAPLREGIPEVFAEFVRRYGELIDLALDQRAFRVEHNISEGLRSMADELGNLKAGPRDVVEIYSEALTSKTDPATPQKKQAYIEEGRLMLIELMGHLLAHYRRYSFKPRIEHAAMEGLD